MGAHTNATTLAYRDRDVTKGLTYWLRHHRLQRGGNSSVAVDSLAPYSLPGPPIDLGLEELDRVVVSRGAPRRTLAEASSVVQGLQGRPARQHVEGHRARQRHALLPRFKPDERDALLLLRHGRDAVQRERAIGGRVAIPYGPPRSPWASSHRGRAADRPRLVAPRTDNGRPITITWSGGGHTHRDWTTSQDRQHDPPHPGGPENGVAYYFQVAAVNLRARGCSARRRRPVPMGRWGNWPPQGRAGGEGVRLVWEPPVDSGGPRAHLHRGEERPRAGLQGDGQVSDALEFLDNTTVAGGTYTYRVAASTLASVDLSWRSTSRWYCPLR